MGKSPGSGYWSFCRSSDDLKLRVDDEPSARHLWTLLQTLPEAPLWQVKACRSEVAPAPRAAVQPLPMLPEADAPPAPVVAASAPPAQIVPPMAVAPSRPALHFNPPIPPASAAKKHSQNPMSGEERRRHIRYDVGLKVVLIADGKAFRTFSSDISVGGFRLAHPLPNGMAERIDRIFVTGPEGSGPQGRGRNTLELRCRVVGNVHDPRRIELAGAPPPAIQELEQWIASELAAKPDRRAA